MCAVRRDPIQQRELSGPLSIREATLADAPRLAELVTAAFAEYRGRLVPESGALSENAEAIGGELAAGHGAFLAELDGRAVGCVLFKAEDGDLYFGRLSVLPECRGLGIAPELVAAVEAEARRRGASGVVLGVRIALPANQRLFERLGYVEVSRHAHAGFDAPTSIKMRKRL